MSRLFLGSALIALVLVLPGAPGYPQGASKLQIGTGLVVTDAGVWRDLQNGVALRKIALQRAQTNYTLELILVRFSSQTITPRVLNSEQFQLKSASAKTFAEKTHAIAAINANYFDEQGRPLAYLKTSIKETNRGISKHSLYTGIFGIGASGPFVTHRDEFEPAEASEALQTGPLLLHRGAPLPLTGALGRYARRSVVGIDKQGAVIIGVADAVIGGLSFSELQNLFMNGQMQADIVELLNLDGGGSAQLYIRSGKFEEWLPGTAEVPVAIGFFKKPN